MGRFGSILGKGIAAAVLIVLAGGLFLAFMTMGPQRQTPVALAPTPSPTVPRQSPPAAPTITPTPTVQPGQKPSKQFPTPTTIPENTPIRIENIGTVAPDPTYEGATSVSESAIIGLVTGVLPAGWNTPDGKRPPVYWGLPASQRDRYGIFTPFVVEVQRYIYNSQPETELVLAMWGGQVGVDSQKVGAGDSPVFEVGERFLAFISRHQDPVIRDSALVQGKQFWLPSSTHVISAEGRAKNRFVDLPLEEVVRRIEAAAARKR